jgi:hypothetical protein
MEDFTSLRFTTLSDGVDEESAYASRMDTWIVWETDEATEVDGLAPRGDG